MSTGELLIFAGIAFMAAFLIIPEAIAWWRRRIR